MKPARAWTGKTRNRPAPEWGPLLALVGEDVAADFMWMFEVVLADGLIVQAYKHVGTRGYLHLGSDGRAFVYEEPNRYRQGAAAGLLNLVLGWSADRMWPL